MSDDLVKHGYADGKYVCSCRRCEGTFMGDKRAWCCKGCAKSADRIEELEANLVKTHLALNYFFMRDPDKTSSWEYNRNQAEQLARTTIAELTGGKDE